MERSALESILALETPAGRVVALFDRIAPNVDAGGVEALTAGEQVVWYVLDYRFKVEMGGFSGTLYNSTPSCLRRTLECLDTIQAKHNARLLRQAIGIWCRGGSLPEGQQDFARFWPLSDKASEKLNALDGEAFEGNEDLDVMLDNYARRNRSAFVDGSA